MKKNNKNAQAPPPKVRSELDGIATASVSLPPSDEKKVSDSPSTGEHARTRKIVNTLQKATVAEKEEAKKRKEPKEASDAEEKAERRLSRKVRTIEN